MNHDIFEQARGAVSPGLIKSMFSSPGEYEAGGEWYILSPLRADKKVGSFSINLSTGLWKDLSTDEGGDFIDLIVGIKSCTKKEAAEEIVRASGGIVEEDRRPVENDPPPPSVWPIPKTALGKLRERIESPWALEYWGKPTNIYKYKSPLGEWMFSVVRFEKGDGKNTIPFYYTGTGWNAKKPDNLKPWFPYRIDGVEPGKPILIVEGEKCAGVKVPGYSVVSWMGGTQRVGDTNWEVLSGHDVAVHIWPDADSQRDKAGELKPENEQPGMKAALAIAERVPGSVILPIYREFPIETDPDGYDIADYVADGKDPVEFINRLLTGVDNSPEVVEEQDDIDRYIEENAVVYHSELPDAPPTDPIIEEIRKTPIDPYAVYQAFITHYFDQENLQQAAGAYWEYETSAHYWVPAMKKDIQCNFQRWMEDVGLHSKISSKTGDAVKFINKVHHYLGTHSIGHVRDNPFQDAAISPYIHVANGAIEITRNGIGWHEREEKGEGFFRRLWPTHCLDFSFDPELMKETVDIEKKAPAFWHFIKGLVPTDELEGKTEAEKDNLYRECMRYIGQIFAYSLSPIKPNEYFFGITGDQSTGKSFFIKLLKSMVGGKFCIERPIADMMKDQFSAANFWGAKVFIEPDLEARAPLPDGFIKTYAGEQSITVRRVYEQAIPDVKISLAMFLVSNYDFVVKGTEGILRRFIYLPYKNRLENPDRTLLDKIVGHHPKGKESGELEGNKFDERPAILALALECWQIFQMNNSEFDVPEWAKREKETWMTANSSAASFVRDFMADKTGSEVVARVQTYDDYREWCKDEDRRPLGKNNFYQEMRRISGVEERKMGGVDMFRFEKEN